MNQDHNRFVALRLAAEASFLPVVMQCVETTAKAFGLGKDELLKLGLASEEIFSYLSNHVCRGEPVEIQCVNRMYYTRVEFRFSVSSLNMGALNITATNSGESDDDLAELGLVIAARTIDRLHLLAENQNRICLAIEKDKDYPTSPVISFKPADIRGALEIKTPDTEGVKRFVMQTAQAIKDPLLPSFFNYPGKVADMVASGGYQLLSVSDAGGSILGGVLYRLLTDRIVELFGPYVFHPSREEEIAAMLLDACIGRVARTKAIGLVNLTGLPASVQSQFEILGSLSHYQAGGPTIMRQAFYRLLHEDPGCQVWTASPLTDYLRGEYERLVLAREIREVQDLGETKAGASIFSSEMYRERAEIVLRPLWPGNDLAENVKRHIHLLEEESFINILFELDLGISWHASLVPVLLNNHFKPEVIIPFAGQADLVVFQYHGNES